jgi:hypothetical protein
MDNLKAYKNIHKDIPVFLVATGPSAEDALGTDFSKLPAILINDATKFWSGPYYFALDRQFMLAAQQIRKNMVIWVWNQFHPFWRANNKYTVPAWFSKCDGEKIKSLQGGLAFGSSSTYAAMHLAAIMGFNPIYLVGNDLAWEPGKKSHIHKRRFSDKGSKRYHYNGITYLTKTSMLIMKKNFEETKKFMDSKGIKVINLSQGILDKYPRKKFKEVLPKIKKQHYDFKPFRPVPSGGSKRWTTYLS